MTDGPRLLASILRHDAKQNTYKLALVRALNDVRLSYLNVLGERGMAVPLRLLAEFWIAYYWPFMDERAPLLQGPQARRDARLRNDLSFRPALTRLQAEWRALVGVDGPADGFTVIHEWRSLRRRATLPASFHAHYRQAVAAVVDALRQPIRYAGVGTHGIFPKPAPADALGVPALPGTGPREVCVVVPPELWSALAPLSLWVEALCVYEWSQFTATRFGHDRSHVYALLTARPDNRRPLTWERNQIELLMLEGQVFTCPWTRKPLSVEAYDVDHVLPLSVYPINELWNLVPADRSFNQHRKRDRLPGAAALERAGPVLEGTYARYLASPQLAPVLAQDVTARFAVPMRHCPEQIAAAVTRYVEAVADARNLTRF